MIRFENSGNGGGFYIGRNFYIGLHRPFFDFYWHREGTHFTLFLGPLLIHS